MHMDLTTLQMKITKKQSISMAFQRPVRPFLVRNMTAEVFIKDEQSLFAGTNSNN